MRERTPRHVIVIGGGIAGLSAAHRLTGAGARVTLVESAERLGGKLWTGELAGVPVDFGADALPGHRPEAVDLARAVGLGDRLRPPSGATPLLWSHRPQGLTGGTGALADAVGDAVRAAGARILLGSPALALSRGVSGWQVRLPTRTVTGHAVVIAAPAWVAATLLSAEAPAAAAELSQVSYTSTALVTMAFRRADVEGPHGFAGRCGYLVPPVPGRAVTAAAFLTRTWGWLDERAPELFLLRATIGRHGEEDALYLDDRDLTAATLRDLSEAAGLTAHPLATEVTRWIGAVPRHVSGHAARITRVRRALAKLPGLRICGAAYEGAGIADCVAGGWRAAEGVLGERG
ncbi:protoporphyrinogen/coproporphyrinogen oxidase [Streptomyces gamaensis]|uniref:Protoporphyrinogen/coproporphyrinogen oxidase n=1 Tax=Streptomyces gamaensis TaxID=1763542 RepID=A0ABW0Z6E4_9ACTN